MAQTKVKLISDGVIVQGNLHASHGITTAHIGEGSNLYYTDARVGSYLSTNSFATESYVGTQIANLVDSSPSALNTLNELAAALGDDANFSTTVTNSIALKAPLASPSFTGNATFAGSITTNLSSEGTYFIGGSGGVRQLSITSGTNISAHALHTFNIASSNGKYEFDINGTTELLLDRNIATFRGELVASKVLLDSGEKISWGTQGAVSIEGSTGSNQMEFRTGASDRMIINSTGVGIGTTSPSAKLEVNTDTNNDGITLNGSSSNLRFNIKNDQVTSGKRAFSMMMSGSYPALIFQGLNDSYGFTRNIMAIEHDGNVGIGTIEPDKKLHILDTSAGAVTYPLRLQNSGTTVGTDVGLIFTTKTSNGGSASCLIRSESEDASGNSSLVFFTPSGGSATEKMRIDSSGNVGIGVNDPKNKLNIFSGTDTMMGFWGTSTYSAMQSVNLANTVLKDMRFDFDEAFFIGNAVGIGTDSPNATLSVKGPNSSTHTIEWKNANRKTGYLYSDTGGVAIFTTALANAGIYLLDNQRIDFRVNGSERMRIDSSGNVMMGKTNQSGNAALTIKSMAGGNTGIILVEGDTTNDGWGMYAVTVDEYRITRFTNGSYSDKFVIKSDGKVNIGTTGNFSAGKLVIQNDGRENGGILDIQTGGSNRYYTRVCHNQSSASTAGYWHIKTNIVVNTNVMFLAKFYGYIYGSAQVLDLTHAGYAYSGTNTVINQVTTNNGSNANASSAVYSSSNGNKLTFRIAFGTGSNFSTYFAGVYMDMSFPAPAGAAHEFEIEAQSFSTSTTVY